MHSKCTLTSRSGTYCVTCKRIKQVPCLPVYLLIFQQVFTVDREIFGGNNFRRLNFHVVLFSSLWPLDENWYRSKFCMRTITWVVPWDLEDHQHASNIIVKPSSLTLALETILIDTYVHVWITNYSSKKIFHLFNFCRWGDQRKFVHDENFPIYGKWQYVHGIVSALHTWDLNVWPFYLDYQLSTCTGC